MECDMPRNDCDYTTNGEELAICKALAEVMQKIDNAQTQKQTLLQKLWDLTHVGVTASADQTTDKASAHNSRDKARKGAEASNEVIDRLAEEYLRKVHVCAMPSILAYIKSAGFVITNARPGNRVAAIMRNLPKYEYDPRKETWSLSNVGDEKVFKMRA
jgi:hypothetical protein